jgi:tRNA dimethylallyltransferase
VLEPTESASVAWWLERAKKAVQEIESRGRLPLFVGGTPFYLKAMVHGIFEAPPIDPAIRRELEFRIANGESSKLHEELAQLDPITAKRLHPNDAKRVVRALEVQRQYGRPLSDLQQQNWFEKQTQNTPRLRGAPQILCLEIPRQQLYSRIDQRVQSMIESGWLEEVRRLHDKYLNLGREASQAVGYRILKDCLAGKIDLPSGIEMIQMKTRRFAKHQLTWFRGSWFCSRCENSQVLLNWTEFLL